MIDTILTDNTYHIIPLRNKIVYSHLIMSILIGREESMNTIINNKNKNLLFLLQKDPKINNPTSDDFYEIGTIATVLNIDKLSNKNFKVTIEGHTIVQVHHITNNLIATVTPLQQIIDDDENIINAKINIISNTFEQYLKLKKQYSINIIQNLLAIKNPFIFLDFISMYIEVDYLIQQQILSQTTFNDKFKIIIEILEYEITDIQLHQQISQNIKEQYDVYHRKILLTTKKEAILKELATLEGEEDTDLNTIQEQINNTKLSPEAKEKAEKELKKLHSMNSTSSEAVVIRGYLDWLLSLPWGQTKEVQYCMSKAKKELDKNHYGLNKIKERIYEMIAVESRVGVAKSPILCLHGPPGVGKTSLAKSIADATGREFISISLGGVSDEAEIRGHRSTYIGAKPGKIIQGLRRAKTDNPVFLLDEIGEIGQDMRGNPAAALLELLDPEQRHEFRDNFLEVAWPFDKAMIVASANTLSKLSPALVDRMEVIDLFGYTVEEKFHIAKNHLIAKQMTYNGLQSNEMTITDDAILMIINQYTKEAGVRNLGKIIAKICRKVVLSKLEISETPSTHSTPTSETSSTHSTPTSETSSTHSTPTSETPSTYSTPTSETPSTHSTPTSETSSTHTTITDQSIIPIIINTQNLHSYLKTPYYTDDNIDLTDKIGVASGLAWTQVGGEILHIEAIVFSGDGKLTVTGKLGDVMKESIYTALSVVKANAIHFNKDIDFNKLNIHVHLPAGAISKDGPSAGIAITLAILSAVFKLPLRGTVAMTGEINLQGKALEIGGLKEKLLAAVVNKIHKVLIPQQNAYQLDELREEIDLTSLNIIPITSIQEAINIVLISETKIPLSHLQSNNSLQHTSPSTP